MSIPTQKYEDIFQDYSDALQWMKGIGVNLGSGRTNNYLKMIEYWKDNYRTAEIDEAKRQFPDFVNSMHEVYDFIDIYKSFENTPIDQLTHIAEKLQKGVKGPINSFEETAKSTTARNFLFEATFAAKVHKPERGIMAILDAESDTGIQVDNEKIWVECKRVTTTENIETNVRKASNQLDKIIKKQVGSGHRGIVALEVTKVLNIGDKIYVSNCDSTLVKSIDTMMDEFISQHFVIWQELYKRKNKKIIGTVVRFSFMSTSESRQLLVHTSQWALNPRLGISSRDNDRLRFMATNFNDH